MLSWFLGSPGYFLINSYSKMKENDLLAHRPICRLFLNQFLFENEGKHPKGL